MKIYNFIQGNTPLLVSIPHSGTFIPDEIMKSMTPEALKLPDTDWHVDKLYSFLEDGLFKTKGSKTGKVSIIAATHSRYVVDLNRPADNSSLYPGQDVPGICPINTFDKQAIYQKNKQPDKDEINQRIENYWKPYHNKLDEQLKQLVKQHGFALLWDAHSIKSHVPRFFSGKLPDLNFGTADNQSCPEVLSSSLLKKSKEFTDYTSILNGRFKGGYITRSYGQPENNIYSVQLELSQATYMQEEYPFEYDEKKALKIQPVLKQLIELFLSKTQSY